MPPYSVGIVGCGKAAGANAGTGAKMSVSHIEAVRDNPALKPVAAYDTDEAASKRFCGQWDLARADSWEDLLRHRPDALLIASPTETHAGYLRRALTAGTALVVCEKPLAETAPIVTEVLAGYRAGRSSLLVFYPRRWITALDRAQAEIRQGSYGELLAGHGWYGNGLRNIGSHMVDLVQRLVGPIRAVEAAGPRPAPPLHADPTVDVALILENGRRIVLQGYDYKSYALFELDLLFERGRFRLVDLGFSVEVSVRSASPHYAGFFEPVVSQRIETDYHEAARALWAHAVNVLRSGRHVVDGGDMAILSVINSAMMCISEGQRKLV